MPRLIMIGAGGHGKVAADVAAASGWEDIQFLDQSYPDNKRNGSWEIVGHTNDLEQILSDDDHYFVSIGSNKVREVMISNLQLSILTSLQHPTSWISPSAKLGNGVLVVGGVIVNADAQIGAGVILNTGCTIDHDCHIGEYTHISPGANLAGNVSVGARTWIGIGAVIRQGICIGKDVMIAAGAVVVDDIPDRVTVMGVPAKVVV